MNQPTMRERLAVLREQHGAPKPEQVWALLTDAGRARVDETALAMRRETQNHNARQRASERNSK